MDLPFNDNSFDMVISIASFKHWPDGTKGLMEISRVLKPGCKAYIGEVDRNFERDDMERFLNSLSYYWWANKQFFGLHMEKIVFGTSYSLPEAKKMAEEAGFAEIIVEKVDRWPVFRLEVTNPL